MVVFGGAILSRKSRPSGGAPSAGGRQLPAAEAQPRRATRAPSKRRLSRIALLGATGSIGASTLSVIEQLAAAGGQPAPHPSRGPNGFEIVALTAGRKVQALADLAARWRPPVLGLAEEGLIPALRAALAARGVRPEPEILVGPAGLRSLAANLDYDLLLLATVGIPGLGAAETALLRGKVLALANKEALVAAGQILRAAATRGRAAILPVDSEHSAIHQCLRAGQLAEVARVILTASGGPFLDWPAAQLAAATPAQALRHPTWRMGPRITADSATLMNKGFELLEACHLFDLDESQVDVLIHPQSIVHSMVEFRDGSVLAQMATADMRTAIQYALTYPSRLDSKREKLDLSRIGRLEFREADENHFRALRLARAAWRAPGAAGAVLNAADEIAVAAFLEGSLPFLGILDVVEEVLNRCQLARIATLDDVLAADQEARLAAKATVKRLSRQAAASPK